MNDIEKDVEGYHPPETSQERKKSDQTLSSKHMKKEKDPSLPAEGRDESNNKEEGKEDTSNPDLGPKSCGDYTTSGQTTHIQSKRLIYCHMPAGWGLQQTTRAPGSDKTRGQGSFGPLILPKI